MKYLVHCEPCGIIGKYDDMMPAGVEARCHVREDNELGRKHDVTIYEAKYSLVVR